LHGGPLLWEQGGDAAYFSIGDDSQHQTIQEIQYQRDPVGQEVLLQGMAFQVLGVLEKRGSQFGGSADSLLLIPLTVCDALFPQVKDGNGDTLHIATVPRDPLRVKELTDQEVAVLRLRRGLKAHQDNDFAIFTSDESLQTFRQITGSIAAAMIFIAAIALLVGGVGVMNIMLVSVTERTREIGVRQAIGATPNDIRFQFLAEALMLSLAGGLLGVLVGVGGSLIFNATGISETVIVPSSILLAFASAAAVGIFFGYYPANRASKLNPIEALRYE